MKTKAFTVFFIHLIFWMPLFGQKGEVTTSEFYLELSPTTSKFTTDLPPILSIDSLEFSDNLLEAGESATLSISLKNVGPGEARDIRVLLNGSMPGLNYPEESFFPVIAANGGTQKMDIEISSNRELTTGEAVIQIEVVDPNFKVKIQGKQLKFPTLEFPKPELILAQYAVQENQSAAPNSQIDINETIDLKVAIQNVGQGNAENVEVEITCEQDGVMLLGVVRGNQIIRENPSYASIEAGKYETITYRYFVNSEFKDENLEFGIRSKEKFGEFGFSEIKSFPINKTLAASGYIRTITSSGPEVKGKVVIEDIPDLVSDVDIDIPAIDTLYENAFALIIGNENYLDEIKVPYAINDASTFRKYALNVLGVPINQVHYLANASYGKILGELDWINNVMKAYNGDAKVYFYYAGHGIPDEATNKAFILPIDGNSSNTKTAIELADVYKTLSEYPSSGVTVFLDACFSGDSRSGMLIAGRGVKIKPKDEQLKGKIVVLSATSDTETAHPYDEKSHGLFTYYLLKKLKETEGDVTLAELSEYVIEQVSRRSVVNNNPQTPSLSIGNDILNSWETLTIK